MNILRVVLRIDDRCSELGADLEKLPARIRAERLRILATAGLAALRGTAVIAPAAPVMPPVVSEELKAARRALFRKLGASLDSEEK